MPRVGVADGPLCLLALLGQCASGHGISPGFPGLPDPLQLGELSDTSYSGDTGEASCGSLELAEGQGYEGAQREEIGHFRWD